MSGPRWIVAAILCCFRGSAQQYTITTLGGGAPPPTGIAAAHASIGDPPRVAVDARGNVYFGSLHSVFQVTPSGKLVRIAGIGRPGYAGDGGQAANAQLGEPDGIAIDGAGAVYVADSANQCVRKIDASGIISTIVGTGSAGFYGDGGPAAAAQL